MLKREIERDTEEKENALKEKNSEIEKLSKRIQESENRIANLSTSIGKDEAFNLLRKEGSLTERVERIGKELDWLKDRQEIINELKEERKEAEGELEKISGETDNINMDSFKLSEIESALERTKKDIDEVNKNFRKKIEKIEENIKHGNSKLKELQFGEAEKKKLSEIREKVSEMRTKRPDLEEKRRMVKEFGDLGLLIKDLDSQKKALEKELKEMNQKVSTLKKKEEKYQEVKENLQKEQAKKEELLKEISHAEGEIKRLSSQIEELKALKKGMKEKEKELKALQEESEVLSILKDKVFHNRGIVMYAIDQLLPQLSLETSTNLSDMTDGRFSKVRLTSFGSANRYGVKIAVSGPDGNWHDVQEFSGGERTQINAALRFAIAKELAGMPQVGRTYGRMKTLFIDEGDLGSLDTESSRQLFVKKLFDMSEFFEKIILITHLTEVAELFPSRVVVYMTPEQESRIQVVA
jgi:exonuclease SbcC